MASSSAWDAWLDSSIYTLQQSKLMRSLRPISSALSDYPQLQPSGNEMLAGADFVTFDGPGPWDRQTVEMELSDETFRRWKEDVVSTGDEVCSLDEVLDHLSGLSSGRPRKLTLFSGNDYLGLSGHPSVRRAAAKAALEFGMGPRGSALICGYTHYHRLLESALADLKKTEDCLLCPTGFAANLAVITTLAGDIAQKNSSPAHVDKLSIFSDSLNHASIIDGIRLAQRQNNVDVHIYRHNDMSHLEELLLSCSSKRKAVLSDSLFSMDGDFARLAELDALRKKYRFLLVLDDAHGTLVCGEQGGGAAEAFGIEPDICVGTLSKAFGCQGGYIASSQRWKQLIQSRARSFIFSTALSVPMVAAAHAALLVARDEKWRQQNVWQRVKEFSNMLGIRYTSPIAPVIIGGAEHTLAASRYLLEAGFHATAIRPPSVPVNSSRLRITLSASHTTADVTALVSALSSWLHEQSIHLKTPSTIFRGWLPSIGIYHVSSQDRVQSDGAIINRSKL